MEEQQVGRRPGIPVEAVTSIILSLIVFVAFAGAVMSGRLPLPHI